MFNSITDVKNYITKTVLKFSKEFVTQNYSIRYSNRQRRALASTRMRYLCGKPMVIEFVFNNKYLQTYDINEDNIKDTVLHEIAHAIVGNENKHNERWRVCCNRIGCRARATKKINKYN